MFEIEICQPNGEGCSQNQIFTQFIREWSNEWDEHNIRINNNVSFGNISMRNTCMQISGQNDITIEKCASVSRKTVSMRQQFKWS